MANEYRNPEWKCECGNLNNFAGNAFAELCRECKTDHTNDWETLIVDKWTKLYWTRYLHEVHYPKEEEIE